MSDTITISIHVNGKPKEITCRAGTRLSEVLRENLHLTGTKVGCNAGDCGACTVLVNDEPVCACLMTAAKADGNMIETVEGLSQGEELSLLQQSFLRHGAAQCGICTPGMLMAAMPLLRSNSTPTRQQVEDALGGVLCRCTGYSKIIDAVMDASEPKLANPMPATGQAVGARVERLDGIPKINGVEQFGADAWPDEALYVRVLRSPYHYADFRIGNVEHWIAATEGVDHVFLAADIDGENCFGVIPPLADQPALAEKVARFKGEAVALIAGRADIMPRLDLSDFPITWDERPAMLDVDAATSDGAPDIHEHRKGNILISGAVKHGDIATGFAEAEYIAEKSFSTGYVEHAYIEPEAGAAWMEDGPDGKRLVISACTQAPIMDRDDTAKVLGLPLDKLRIIPAATGGGFGSKLDVTVQPLLGLVTLKTGKPCRMVFSRHESMTSSTKRHPGKMRARIGARADGRITAMSFEGDFNTGAYASWGPTVATRVPIHASGPYLTPHYHAVANAVHTNGPISGAFRGFGVPQSTIIQEALYDELADQCGIDRLAFRRKNVLKDGDKTVCGQVLTGVGIDACLAALEPFWSRHSDEIKMFNDNNARLKRGIGVSSCWYGCGNTALPNPSTIRLGVTSDGVLVLHQGASDIGQGANTVIPQICADALGVPLATITIVNGDTAITPDCGKTSASRQTFITGKAAMLAGQALRQQILRQGNLGDDAAITLHQGKIIVSNGDKQQTIDLTQITPNAHGYVLMAEETYNPPTEELDENGQGKPYALYGFGAHAAVVEVDTHLGTVKVRHISAAHDLGRVVNPMLAEGQIDGGIAQGLGMALMEEYIPGRSENLHDYLIPSIGDMPEIEHHLIEISDPEGPMGVKGLGEHVLIPTAPAILNAISHATGGAILSETPATPHRVLAAIMAMQSQHKAAE
jgi:aldehyde oxidoreductase